MENLSGIIYVVTNKVLKNFLPGKLVLPTSHANGKVISKLNIIASVANLKVLIKEFQFIMAE